MTTTINIDASTSRYEIAPSTAGVNVRNSSNDIIKLNDGRLLLAYARYGASGGDTSPAQLYYSISLDDGKTWGATAPLIPIYINGDTDPSFHRRSDGNILLMFNARVSALETVIAKCVIDDNLNIITPTNTVSLPTGYHPSAHSNLHFDGINLLFPYPKLISGTGVSGASVYESRLLVSSDDGDTFTDAGISTGTGLLNVSGFGGASEPGVYSSPITGRVFYFRTLLGSCYSVQLNYASGVYSFGTTYQKLFSASNARSRVVYDDTKKLFYATRTRVTSPRFDSRNFIDLLVSSNGYDFNTLNEIDFALPTRTVNEPSIFNTGKSLLVTYSKNIETTSNFSLLSKRIPLFMVESQLVPSMYQGFHEVNGRTYNGYEQRQTSASASSYIVKVQNPNGKFLKTTSTTQTGALEIVLPNNAGTFLTFRGTVFERVSNQSFTFIISCYPASMVTANEVIILGRNNDRKLPVRFCTDGTRPKVYIGELNQTWSFVSCTIDEVQGCHVASIADLAENWEVNLVTDAFKGTISETITNTLVYSSLDQPITGLPVGTNTPIVATDSILIALSKLQAQIDAL